MSLPKRLVTHAIYGEIVPGPLGASRSSNLTGRVPKADAERFRALAAKLGSTPGALLRELAKAATSGDPAEVLRQIAVLLELPNDSLPQEIATSLQNLIDEIGAPQPGDEAMADVATAPTPAKLSVAQAAALRRRGLPLTVAAWKQLTAGMVRKVGDAPATTPPATRTVGLSNTDVTGLSDAERAYLSCHPEITREEYLAKKAGAVKRHR